MHPLLVDLRQALSNSRVSASQEHFVAMDFMVLGLMIGAPFELSRRLKNALLKQQNKKIVPPLPEPAQWTIQTEPPPYAIGHALDIDIWAANRADLDVDVWASRRQSLDRKLVHEKPHRVSEFRRREILREDIPPVLRPGQPVFQSE